MTTLQLAIDPETEHDPQEVADALSEEAVAAGTRLRRKERQ